MNSFRCMGTGGHNATVIIQKKRPTKPEETVKQWLEWDSNHDALYQCQVRSNPPQGCLWRLWLSHSAWMQSFLADAWILVCQLPDTSRDSVCPKYILLMYIDCSAIHYQLCQQNGIYEAFILLKFTFLLQSTQPYSPFIINCMALYNWFATFS
jgi:hypothetical protein